MTLDEMKLAVCEKLPELIGIDGAGNQFWEQSNNGSSYAEEINWPTEGLQVCHEAEKLLLEQGLWSDYLTELDNRFVVASRGRNYQSHATYEQRLEALCRVWFPERFK